MSLSENDIALRIVRIKSPEEYILFIDWLTSYAEIEWTEDGKEPDVIKALVFNHVFCNDVEKQSETLAALLRKKNKIHSDNVKALLKRGCQARLLQQYVDRFNETNDEDAKAEMIKNENSNTTKILFTRVITVGTKESLEQ